MISELGGNKTNNETKGTNHYKRIMAHLWGGGLGSLFLNFLDPPLIKQRNSSFNTQTGSIRVKVFVREHHYHFIRIVIEPLF